MAPCASCDRDSGTGRHRIRSGGRASRGTRTSRPTRSTTASACCSSTRSACRARSRLAADRETAIVLTAPWHERDSRSLVERLGAPVYTPLPDTARVPHGEVRHHRRAGGRRQPRRRLAAQGGKRRGAPVRGGRPTRRRGPGVPRAEAERPGALGREPGAVVVGDTLVDFGDGLQINPRWLDRR